MNTIQRTNNETNHRILRTFRVCNFLQWLCCTHWRQVKHPNCNGRITYLVLACASSNRFPSHHWITSGLKGLMKIMYFLRGYVFWDRPRSSKCVPSRKDFDFFWFSQPQRFFLDMCRVYCMMRLGPREVGIMLCFQHPLMYQIMWTCCAHEKFSETNTVGYYLQLLSRCFPIWDWKLRSK